MLENVGFVAAVFVSLVCKVFVSRFGEFSVPTRKFFEVSFGYISLLI